MTKRTLFEAIAEEKLPELFHELNAEERTTHQGEVLLEYSGDQPHYIAMLIEGTAELEMIDANQHHYELGLVGENDVFGDFAAIPLPNLRYVVTATTDCKFILLDWEAAFHDDACFRVEQRQLLENLFLIQAQKMAQLSFHLSLLFQPTTREKLISYLNFIQAQQVEPGSFTLPISLSKLADYLHVDRASMMRSLQGLKKENVLKSKARQFELIKSPLEMEKLLQEQRSRRTQGAFISAVKED